MSKLAPRLRSGWIAYVACAWAVLFAAVSFYWAAGGTIGLSTLSAEIRDRVGSGDAAFVALVWVTGVLKLLAGVLALALVRPWGRFVHRRLLLVAAWGTGALLALYGAVGLVQAVLVFTGAVSVAEPVDRATLRWYLFLWEPFWLLGGILFLAAAWIFTRHRRGVDI